MEARKISVISNKTQGRYTLMSAATTLGELKADFSAAGIDYADMAFIEGRSKTELMDDNSVLPTNLPTADGGTTNELVFMLTNMKKKIESGCSRKEIYMFLQQHPDMKNKVFENFGIAYTNVPTNELVNFLGNVIKALKNNNDCECDCAEKLEKIEKILTEAMANGDIEPECFDELMSVIHSNNAFGYTDDEIEEMFSFLQ